MQSIIYEPIQSNNQDYSFGYALYGNFKVIMINSLNHHCDGFINATELCKQGNKKLSNWVQNRDSKELVNQFKASLGCEISLKLLNIENDLKGTYVHRKLIVHIASWVSPIFALWVSDIVDDYVLKSFADENAKLERVIQTQDDKIDKLMAQLKANDEKMTKKLNTIGDDLVTANDSLVVVKGDLNLANDNLCDIKAKLKVTKKERVVMIKDKSKHETLAIIKLNNSKEFKDVDYEYFIAKRQSSTIGDCLKKNPGTILARYECQPNAHMLFGRIKEVLAGRVLFRNGHISLISISERRMLKKIEAIEKEKEDDVVLDNPYYKLNCINLRDLWRERNMKGFSGLSKEALIQGLVKNDKTDGDNDNNDNNDNNDDNDDNDNNDDNDDNDDNDGIN